MAAIITLDLQTIFIFIFLCLFSLLCYSLFFIKPKNSRDGRSLPPSPPSLPIIGHLHLILMSSLTHKSFQRLSSKYGPLLHLHIFHIPIVLASSASVAYDIFRDQDVNVSFRSSPPIEESLLLGSYSFISAPYGDYWKFMRKLMVTKILGPQALERSRRFREDELDRFYKVLVDKAVKKETVEIGEEAAKFNNNTICKMIMGRSCSEENGEAERVRGLVTESMALTKKIFLATVFEKPLRKLGISLFKKEIMSVSHKFDELLEKILVEHEEKLEEHHHQGTDMMDVLLEAYRDEDTEYKITRNHIKSLFVDLFIAGTDTSSTTTQWIMAEIINHPKIFERLREEIDSVVGKTRLVQETDLPNLPYLQAIIKEGLRLHPPGPLVPRTLQERCEIKGFHIPEKTIIIVNSYAIMRDPDFWEDPEEFKPERFLGLSRSGQEDEKRDKFLKYIPFASGRRGCPGTNLAYVSVGTAIGVMVQCFDWKIEGEEVNMNEAAGTMVLTMAKPLKCTPVPRTLNPLPS
ncbi:PREDICTED: cytochrome P450 705A5-like [Camelina sativa]|uniref:Cytochrome P450 705A5-like n=1 Tax=Camelina sativa TaxID=90675 RepID=A0ABM0U2V6_CAMSA|nr:PREDICTED: cytochrome P450 705A5-like [Camelina sativa]